ncbi:MAG: hypothetical protein DYG89_18535 [Caldilinea sp. CFX5]|nr:hypothetical protein [Caldilinea sp. CFX5]
MNQLVELADLLKQYNQIGAQIAAIIGRPAQIGHIGEFIAAQIFDIALEPAANAKAIDGKFRAGALTGHTVNIKWYAKRESCLDITPTALPDYYLVFAGPKAQAMTSRGDSRPWLIQAVYLFEARQLVAALQKQGINIGIATSVKAGVWQDAMLYPQQHSALYPLSDQQKVMLALFT